LHCDDRLNEAKVRVVAQQDLISRTMPSILLIAYHFPPIQGSSGFQRALSLTRYLPDYGWQTRVLTVDRRAYEQVNDGSESLIPAETHVHRAWAVDSKRHLSFRGRYPDIFEVPDRWQSWIIPAIAVGVRLVRREGLDAVFSTYPIASAHIIGYAVSRLTGKPWIADLRDPMLQDDIPRGRLRRWSFGWIERLLFKHASKIVVTTAGCAELYRERYGVAARDNVAVIENGYDEGLFPQATTQSARTRSGPLTLVHSGVLYKDGRDPSNFFLALRSMLDERVIDGAGLRIVFRAPGGELPLQSMIEAHGLAEIACIEPPIPYRDALEEMMSADGLLIFQGASCNRQIPAKAYEYVYTRTPIVGIADPAGDTGRLLASLGITTLAPLESVGEIKQMLTSAIPLLRSGTIPAPDDRAVAALSRRERTREYAELLDEVVGTVKN